MDDAKVSARYGILYSQLSVKETPDVLKIIYTIAIVLACLPELDGKMLLLKTAGHRTYRHQAGVDCEIPSSRLAFTQLGSIVPAIAGERSTKVISSCEL